MKETLPFKGFIFPNGNVITPDYTLSHESMASRYIRDNGLVEDYRNSTHSSAQDFLVFKLNAMQIRSGGAKVLILLFKNQDYFKDFIFEYKKQDPDWKVLLL